MKINFSFKYNGEIVDSHYKHQNNGIYEIGNGITVTLKKKEYNEYDAVEWVLYFENQSEKNSEIFSDIFDCDTLLPLKLPESNAPCILKGENGDACVITMNGTVKARNYWENDEKSASEFGFNYEYFNLIWKKSFENTGGRSSSGMMPFFDITSSGSGYIAAIGWTGDWKAEFEKCDNGVQMKTGLKETKFYLKPGERIRTSSMLIMKYSADENKHNKFRKLIKNHFSHKSCTSSDRDGLMAFELWGGLSSEEMKKRINELKKYDIKFEDIWIDAGWYGDSLKCEHTFSGDWSKQTGNWYVNKRVHPNNLKDVAKCAKDAKMNLMLWVEPERAINGTELTIKHPEWFLEVPKNENKILNYGNKEAREYIYKLLEGLINELELSCYRQDFNTDLSGYFENNDEENRRGITEIKHIMGMYEIWDNLLEKFPHLIIDNCSSGGKRIDIETIKRSIPFFRSDYQCNFNANPEVVQIHNSNISYYLPYNGCTTKTKNDTYAVRSSYSSSWGGAFYNAIIQTIDEDGLIWAKKITDEYRLIRKYFSMDFYNHGSVCFDETSWTVWQYHDFDTQSGVVMAFRRSNSPFESVKIHLNGLLENKQYTITNLDTNETDSILDTIEILLPQKRSCTILEYKIKQQN